MAKDAYFFSHDSNARTDVKVVDMMYDYGLSGYGMFWIIVETLRETDGYKLENNKSTWRALAMQMHNKSDEVQKFISDCIEEYGLFCSDGVYFWSNSLMKRMDKVEDIRQKRKNAAEKRWNSKNNANALQEQSTVNEKAMQLDAKESKVKEKKVKENKEYIEIIGCNNVFMTQVEYDSLIGKYDEVYVKQKIYDLSEYLDRNPKKNYVSHYRTLLKWIAKDGDNAVPKQSEKTKNAVIEFKKRTMGDIPDFLKGSVFDERS